MLFRTRVIQYLALSPDDTLLVSIYATLRLRSTVSLTSRVWEMLDENLGLTFNCNGDIAQGLVSSCFAQPTSRQDNYARQLKCEAVLKGHWIAPEDSWNCSCYGTSYRRPLVIFALLLGFRAALLTVDW